MIQRFAGAKLDKSEESVLSHIEQHGWNVTHIREEEGSLGWSFTIGLFENYKHPEIILFGMSQQSRHSILNWIGENVKEGKAFSASAEHNWVLEGYNCWSREVQKKWYPDLVGWATWFYGGLEFPCVQCFWPAKDGAFPWEDNRVSGAQPLLYENSVLAARMLHYVDDQTLNAEEWPFENDPHEGVFVSRCVWEDGAPIVSVHHDQDGDWQFLGPVDDADADGCKLSCFHCVVERDGSVRKLARLPVGSRAWREKPAADWVVERS